MGNIQQTPSYEEMRDEAVQKYYAERKTARIFLVIGILLFVISAGYTLSAYSGHSILFLIGGVVAFFSAWWVWDSLKKFPEAKRNYIYRLNRAVEIMSNANVFMQVPQEDLHRFDHWWE